ncbi:MAG: transcriptional regulator [Candidatus Thalassarchaeum betae]|jgi:DNA-binding Lrp family transcriptional regulator|uniref:Transcriptional regulator n=1 Tax=Candidatus Thalassarchaeum betae TaxID=2599289 RepID=A0A2V3HTE9_9ARCH|nr:Lrp/AsnC family transcriptional regulator [Candidatus Thalassoarchaea betae]PXF27134.1 MAG: transcriptional regulator [Euryarchaeota archaeon]HIC50856.1 Lrp/AsnC family transcriptional regulator [Candidatus Poseidoniales archaeon]PXF22394.1 MAG: transcriptional regulator [Candidatus Thalassoarchaea betae]HIM13583.1 Lrp/AsnC family transcriptional regulator [Candidatus Poseidoniales archaeon]
MPLSELDNKDARIVAILEEDARASTQAIADALGMPRVTVHDRIRRLQERGVVKRFTVELGKVELGWQLHAYILANWAGERGHTDRRDVAEEICGMPFVIGCHIVTGQWDFIIEVLARNMEDLGDSILDDLSAIPGVGHTQTLVSFYSFEGEAWPLR